MKAGAVDSRRPEDGEARPEQGAVPPDRHPARLQTERQHRWVIRPSAEEAAVIVVQVVDGQVLVDAPRGPVTYSPRDVERLRRALASARATAIWDRGDW